MPLHFPYRRRRVSRPVHPLGGAFHRSYPLVPVIVSGPSGSFGSDGLLDSGADDTVFPEFVAQRLGIDLRTAVEGEAHLAGGQVLVYHYAPVTFRISDSREACQWQAIVGFVAARMRWPLLGQTGFLLFFDALFRGADQEVVLTPNRSFPGLHIIP